MSLVVYNTLSKTKEVLRPQNSKEIKMYVCGPTVYGLLHVGNFRGAIFFNLVRNWLEHLGYQVTYVYNYTDVDDKIINKAKEEGVDSKVISERYIEEFKKDFNRLGLKPHEHNPKVTEFMPQIIQFIGDLVSKGNAYVIDGEVFYEIEKFCDYGKLSGKKLEELEAGQRVEVDARKKNPYDFVLWKPSKPSEPSWDSPWGKGRPGWHIECSAMIQSLLGDTIDIHGGGIDLIFPHHENEIAQGEGRTEKKYCNHWMHNNFINMNDEKMSKSLGNVVTARSFMDSYHPEILKYLMLSSHYRGMMNFNQEKILHSMAGLARIYHALWDAKLVISQVAPDEGKPNSKLIEITKKAERQIEKAMDDDFNTVEVIAQIFEVVREFNAMNLLKKLKDKNSGASALCFSQWIKHYGEILALFLEEPKSLLKHFDKILILQKGLDANEIESLVMERKLARENKDFKRSDEIREKLALMDVLLNDSPDGNTYWEIKK